MHEKGMSELFAKDSDLCKNIAVLKGEVATLLHIVGFPGPRPTKEPAHRQEAPRIYQFVAVLINMLSQKETCRLLSV